MQRIAKRAGGKVPHQKTSKIAKKCQKVFRHFSTIFAPGKKTSKIVKKCQKVFRHFSTIFARHHFSGPFSGALKFAPDFDTKISCTFLVGGKKSSPLNSSDLSHHIFQMSKHILPKNLQLQIAVFGCCFAPPSCWSDTLAFLSCSDLLKTD